MIRGPRSTESPTDHRIAPEWVADGKRRGRRSKLLWGAVGVMAVVVVGLVLYQVLVTTSTPADVTITSVRWNLTQGNISTGQGWFGPSQFNYTLAGGYPMNVSPGKTVSISWAFVNYDTDHTIMSVTANLPFRVVTTHPGLPALVPGGFDDGALLVSVQVPNAPGTVSSLYLNVTIV